MEAIVLRFVVSIDMLIHQGVAELFKLIFRIAEVDIFTEETISTFSSRIYGILGVVILFKIIISCIQYLVNPEKMSDKDKGMGAIIQRTVISFALLALVPTIFSFAKRIEGNIAGVIPALILGQNMNYQVQDGSDTIEKAGSWLSFVTIKTFVTPKENKKAEIARNNYTMENFEDFYDNVTHGCGWLFADENCYYDYNYIFSIGVGVFLLYVLLSMGIDIAIRSIKFGILQLLAPIPIASYVNGQENFKTWYQNAFKVYADLFIRLIIIYFIVYVLVILSNNGINIGNEGVGFFQDPFVTIYIIIGLLLFAKQAPKFICDILGIKSDGLGSFGEMFKPAWDRAKPAFDQVTNPLRNAYANGKYAFQNGRGIGSSLVRAAGGLGAGLRDSLSSIGSGKDVNELRRASMLKSQKRVNRANVRKASLDDYLKQIGNQQSIIDRAKDKISDFQKKMSSIIDTDKETSDRIYKQYDDNLSNKKQQLDNISKQLEKATDLNEIRNLSQSAATLQNEIADMKQNKAKYINEAIISAKYDNDLDNKKKQKSVLEERLNSGVYGTVEEKLKDAMQLAELQNEIDSLETNRDRNVATNIAEFNKLSMEVDTKNSEITKAEKTIVELKADPNRWKEGLTFVDTIKSKVNEDLGLSGITGSAYIQVADLLKNNRSGLWSGEAMNKLTQNPEILTISGVRESETSSPGMFTSKIDGKQYAYAKMRDLMVKVETGNITQTEIEQAGFKSANDIKTIYTDIEKTAASAYVKAAMNGTLKGGNTTITEGIGRMRVDIENASISPQEKKEILKKLDEDPGAFLTGASDRQERLRTKGSRINSFNSGEKEGK